MLNMYTGMNVYRAQVYDWFKMFKEKRETTEDDSRSGRTSTLKTNENIQRICELIREDRRLSIHAVSEIIEIDK